MGKILLRSKPSLQRFISVQKYKKSQFPSEYNRGCQCDVTVSTRWRLGSCCLQHWCVTELLHGALRFAHNWVRSIKHCIICRAVVPTRWLPREKGWWHLYSELPTPPDPQGDFLTNKKNKKKWPGHTNLTTSLYWGNFLSSVLHVILQIFLVGKEDLPDFPWFQDASFGNSVYFEWTSQQWAYHACMHFHTQVFLKFFLWLWYLKC